MRLRWAAAALLPLAAAAAVGTRLAERAVERRLIEAIRVQGGPVGLTVGSATFRWSAPVTLAHVALRAPAGERLTIETARIAWTFTGGREPRAHVRGLSVEGVRFERGPLVAEWPSADLEILAWDHD